MSGIKKHPGVLNIKGSLGLYLYKISTGHGWPTQGKRQEAIVILPHLPEALIFSNSCNSAMVFPGQGEPRALVHALVPFLLYSCKDLYKELSLKIKQSLKLKLYIATRSLREISYRNHVRPVAGI